MDYSFIGFDVADGVATVTFNRPEVMNAWHEAMRNEVLDALSRVRQDDGIRALVFTGVGERAFSAGQDINESNDFDEDRAERWINEFRALYSSVRSLEKPVVAAVNGVAAGSRSCWGCPGCTTGRSGRSLRQQRRRSMRRA